MDFVTKAFGSFNIGLPFKLEDEVTLQGYAETSSHYQREALPYKLYNATLKKDGTECSVFSYLQTELPQKESAMRALRKLKLPGVVKYLETFDRGEEHYIITERVLKFDAADLSYEARKFILQYLLSALKTMETVAQCQYNELCTSTVMLSKDTGLPVLVGFDFVQFGSDPAPALQQLAEYAGILSVPSVELNTKTNITTYQFGNLISIYLPDEVSFSRSLQKHNRPSISKLAGNAKICDLLNNQISDVILEETSRLLLLPAHELARLCEKLVKLAPMLYECIIRASILPQLLKSPDPCTFLAILTLISQLHGNINDDDPAAAFIVHNFTLLDRVVRLRLLEYMPRYISLLSNKLVQQRIMPKMAFGFTDTETVVRKASVAATIYLVDKITSTQLNSDLLRLISRTHADPDPDIRSMSTSVICEIASKLDNTKVIAAALAKALKDPVPKCRSTALINVTKLQLPADVIADKLLASAAQGMLDKDPSIAADSWRVTDYLLGEIRKASPASGPSGPISPEENLPSIESPTESQEPKDFLQQQKVKFGSITTSTEPVTPSISNKEEVEWGWDQESADEDAHVSEVDEEAWGW